MTHIHSSIISSATIARYLHTHPYVNGAISHKNNHYLLALSLQPEVIDVFIKYLQPSRTILAINRPGNSTGESTLSIHTTDAGTELVIQDLIVAFNKVSQYLEYLEIKKDYASGYVPAHLSHWLTESGLHN